jgi:hypothetical protein
MQILRPFQPYGPSNPQLTHLYRLENFLQSSSLQIKT